MLRDTLYYMKGKAAQILFGIKATHSPAIIVVFFLSVKQTVNFFILFLFISLAAGICTGSARLCAGTV